MGFFTGRVTFLRYRVDGPSPSLFGPEHLEQLANHAIGKQRTEAKNGTEVGWIAGDDILDVGFDLAKNVVNDALHFALGVDAQKLPADLLRAYTRRTPGPRRRQPHRTPHLHPEAPGQGSRPRKVGGRGQGRPLPAPQGVPPALGWAGE